MNTNMSVDFQVCISVPLILQAISRKVFEIGPFLQEITDRMLVNFFLWNNFLVYIKQLLIFP